MCHRPVEIKLSFIELLLFLLDLLCQFFSGKYFCRDHAKSIKVLFTKGKKKDFVQINEPLVPAKNFLSDFDKYVDLLFGNRVM